MRLLSLKRIEISPQWKIISFRGEVQSDTKLDASSTSQEGAIWQNEENAKVSKVRSQNRVQRILSRFCLPSKTSRWTSSAPAGTGGSFGFGKRAESFLAREGSSFSGKVMLKRTMSLPLLNGSLCVGIPSLNTILMSACFITWNKDRKD